MTRFCLFAKAKQPGTEARFEQIEFNLERIAEPIDSFPRFRTEQLILLSKQYV